MNVPVTSEARIPVALNQEVDDIMLTNMGLLAQGSLDNLITNCIGSGIGYTGLACAIKTNINTNSATLITVGQGWMKRGGVAYSLRDAADVDLASTIAAVPSGKTAIVLILADGQEAPVKAEITVLDAAKEPADPNAYWPTAIIQGDTAVVRSVIPTKVAGTPDLQPQPPAANPSYCLLATCVVDNGSIISCKQETGQQIVPQEQLATTLAIISAYQTTLPSIINGLLSSVSALAIQLASLSAREQADITSLQNQINALRTQATASPAATFTGVDYFTDLSQSKPDAAGYNALVSGGLRFPLAVKADLPIAAQNPFASVLKQGSGNILMPSFGEYPGILKVGIDTSVGAQVESAPNFGQLGFASLPVARRGFPRQRIQSSIGLTTQSAAQVLASGDPSQLFAIDPATFVYDKANWGDWRTDTTEIVRQNGFWSTLASRDYWSPILGVIGNTAGLPIVSQPIKADASSMVPGMSIGWATYGIRPGANVRVMLCADKAGSPDLMNTYLDQQIQTHGESATTFRFPNPVFTRAGKIYHLVLTSDNPGLAIGMYPNPKGMGALSYINGAWQVCNGGYALNLHFTSCYFGSGLTITVPLGTLNLAAGSDTLDFQFSMLLPDGCNLIIQVLIGGQWVSLAQVLNSTYPLAGNPQTVPCQAVLTTTGQCAPMIDTTVSAARISKASAAMEHVSSIQTPAAPVTTIHKSVVVENWNAAVQTLTAGLRTGPGFATPPVAPTSTKDAPQANGSLLRTWTWTLGAAVPSFEMELDGATTDATQQFVVSRSNWDAAA